VLPCNTSRVTQLSHTTTITATRYYSTLNTTKYHKLSQSYSALFTTIRSYSSYTIPQSICLLSDLRNSLLAPAHLLAALCLHCPSKAKQMDTSSQGSNPYHEIHIWIHNVDPYPFHSIPRRLQHFHIHATEPLPHVEIVERNENLGGV
jgi:hypothetical protein